MLAFAGCGAGAAIALVSEVPVQSLAAQSANALGGTAPRAVLAGAHCIIAGLTAQSGSPEAAKAYEDAEPPLWNDLGSLTYPISTKSEEAQSYFDQGLQVRRQFQPRGSSPRFPQGAKPRSELRDVLPRRGACARAEHQRADGP